MKTPQVYLNMKLKDRYFITISANVVPKITRMIQRIPIPHTATETWFYFGKHQQLVGIILASFEDVSVSVFSTSEILGKLIILLPS